MRYATIRTGGTTRAARVDGDVLVPLDAVDVAEVLARIDAGRAAPREIGGSIPLESADFAPLVPHPSKIFCVGLNYRSHILESTHELPAYPTFFAKYTSALIGARDDIVLPSVSDKVDWEVELGVIVGRRLRRASVDEARDAIGGYCVVNDVSMRDWQTRTLQWLQGKTFEACTPVGPYLVTPDEVDHAADLEVRCEVDGQTMQLDRTSDLVFKPADIVAYASQITTLEPGDLFATGTCAGVGAARNPPVFLAPGQVLRTTVQGLGECINTCLEEKV
jgi:acylpyruvate hydrolase